MPFPDIRPIAFQIGPLAVRWYASSLLRRRDLWPDDKPPFDTAAIWDFAFWAVIVIVLGGRIGYVLFYNLPYYAAHPAEIVALWDGGMAFHGGLAGILIAMALFTRSKGGRILSSFDLLGAIGTIGDFLVRIANFINGELYGAPTELPWGVIFPTDLDGVPRHPSQLYEAGLEGLLLFIVIFNGTRCFGWLKRPGLIAGIFGVLYALSRILVEFIRLPDAQIGYLLGTGWLPWDRSSAC